jgi:hypothetical protein
MRSLFSVHAGEFLAGSHIERHFPRLNLWVPARDSGVDLLVSDARNRSALSLQVKSSRDYLPTHMPRLFQKDLRACTWFKIKRKKLTDTPADLWVLVIHGFARRSTDYVVIPPRELHRRLRSIHGNQTAFQTYLWVTEDGRCWETRGLVRRDQDRIVDGRFHAPSRDFTKWLNHWQPLARLAR